MWNANVSLEAALVASFVRLEPRLSRFLYFVRHVRPRGARSGPAIWKQEGEGVKTEEGYLMTEDGPRLYSKRTGCGPATFIPNGLYLFDDFNQLAVRRTLSFYDVRNRGLSDGVADRQKLERHSQRCA
jgi:hypothetical protein